MKQSNKWLKTARQLCGEIGPEDGIPPHILTRKYDREIQTSRHHKLLQVCKEAEKVITLIFAGEIYNPLLKQIILRSVEPDTNEKFLSVFVEIRPINAAEPPTVAEVLAALEQAQGYLRTELARAINRRRIPALKFYCINKSDER